MHFSELPQQRGSGTRHVLGLSGGKDSAALAIYLKDHYPAISERMEYFFSDTGAEGWKCSPQSFNGYLVEYGIHRNQGALLQSGLCVQQTIPWVFVVPIRVCRIFGMLGRNRQFLDIISTQCRPEFPERQSQALTARFPLEFVDGNRANQYAIGAIKNQFPHPA